ncbi:MAG: ABC transporter permease [Candidatus Bathyarchaeota archaeon]|nr:ABC transporter permease [Candidatus Bathyarchaeota archaeon]
MSSWLESFQRAVYIAEKDIKVYFFKGPNLIFGLILPVSLFLAFSIGRSVDPTFSVPGLVAIASFFGAGAIQAITLPLERRTGTFKLLLTAPISLSTIAAGKVLAGFIYGVILSIAYMAVMLPFTAVANLPLFVVCIAFSAFMFSAFGFLLSVPFKDIPQAMPPATVVRIAMVFISGVFLPISAMPTILQAIAFTMPLTYSVEALRQAMTGAINTPIFLADLGAQTLFSLVFLYLAIQLLKKTIN